MSPRPFQPVSATTDQHSGRVASVLATGDKNALIGDTNTDQGNPLIPLNEITVWE